MFDIILYQVACNCERLQRIVNCQRNEVQNTIKVKDALKSLSGMDEVVKKLQKKINMLEMQQRSLLDMLQGLDRVRQSYEKTERRICDNGEGNNYLFRQLDIIALKGTFDSAQIKTVNIR